MLLYYLNTKKFLISILCVKYFLSFKVNTKFFFNLKALIDVSIIERLWWPKISLNRTIRKDIYLKK